MSDIKKIRDYKKSRLPKPEISKAAHKRNVEDVVNLLMPIIEKVEKLPPVPTLESFDDLMNELTNGVKRAPVIVNREDGRRVQVLDSGEIVEIGNEKPKEGHAEPTLYDTGGAENPPKNKFTETELQILKQIETESRISLLKKII